MQDQGSLLQLSTQGIFIHGNKSQVNFDYYGDIKPRELGDLIFIISIVSNGKKYFEKFTINQFKKDDKRTPTVEWKAIDKKQLYLLSRFPIFKGIKGYIPKVDHVLPNISGVLGSYGLLFKPGDFAFISATELDSYLGIKNKLDFKNLDEIIFRARNKIDFVPHRSDLPFPPEIRLLGLLDKAWDFPLKNFHCAANVFDFAHKYLNFGIGEPLFMEWGLTNEPARIFFQSILNNVYSNAKRKGAQKSMAFYKDFFKFPYADGENGGDVQEGGTDDFEGGKIGIIHTVVNLGE